MGLAAEIRRDVHGVPINHGSVDVVCDQPHAIPRAVDCEGPVQYELAKVGESLTILEGLPIVGVWVPDLLRCADCEVDSLADPTDGYAEALVEVEIGWHAGQRVLDASELRVLEYSAEAEWTDPPPIPDWVLQSALQERDGGALRRSRLATQAELLRERSGNEDSAALLEGLLAESAE